MEKVAFERKQTSNDNNDTLHWIQKYKYATECTQNKNNVNGPKTKRKRKGTKHHNDIGRERVGYKPNRRQFEFVPTLNGEI